ncbi:putative protein disulfide-isomerase A6 [Gossypium australe]|uniref:protein disulfide-isomerase n=1 Tax=Gossypium australe TaxID=47621 RepID=A0A5B6W1W8_9ROSI|nr:putative protein disulfide-isomerase A6 [Gossypium australe]
MKFQVWLALGILALLLASAWSDDVLVLTEENFEKEVGQDRGALVEFYAPWCGHCQKLAPEYEKLGASFKKAKSVLIGKVDCDEHKSVCGKYGVEGYPTIKWFPKGSLEPKQDLVQQILLLNLNTEGGTNVKIATLPCNVVVLNADNFDEVLNAKNVFVECGYCKNLAPTYEKVATAFKMEEDVVIANIDADKYKDLAEKLIVLPLRFFAKAGILSSLDALSKQFVAASIDERKTVFSKIEEEVEKLKGSSASYLEKGADYPRKEIERLQRILDKSISPAKADELTLKKNILSTFA